MVYQATVYSTPRGECSMEKRITIVQWMLAITAAGLMAVAGVASAADKDAKDTKAAKVEAKVETKAENKAENKAEDKIDINRASADELRKIDGIGEARSAAIIKGRPYRSKDELVSKNIIPKAVYDKIKERIIAKQ
jgi:DNA uptake protein ComE-like DNA-binding protein